MFMFETDEIVVIEPLSRQYSVLKTGNGKIEAFKVIDFASAKWPVRQGAETIGIRLAADDSINARVYGRGADLISGSMVAIVRRLGKHEITVIVEFQGATGKVYVRTFSFKFFHPKRRDFLDCRLN
jgi:hypothetical protein